MGHREFWTIIEDPTLTPPQKYKEVREAFPTFGESWICDHIHERHPTWGRYANVEQLVQDVRLEQDNVEFNSQIQPLGTNELHYLCLRLGPLDFGLIRPCHVVAQHPDCDRGTALLLYWAAIYASACPGTAWQCEEEDFERFGDELRAELRPLIEQLAQRLEENRFSSARIQFDPSAEHDVVLQHGQAALRLPSPGDRFDEFAE